MCWCKHPGFIGALLLVLVTGLQIGCEAGGNAVKNNTKFFDLKSYFNAECSRLTKTNKGVNKTVAYNGKPETKTVLIKSWTDELALFSGSDINKPAWRNSYVAKNRADTTIYQATDENMCTRKITIIKHAGAVLSIQIENYTKNLLYTSGEHLVYQPGVFYLIEKKQQIRFPGENYYHITGKF